MKYLSPHRNARLAVILVATALIILSGNAAMGLTLHSPAFQQNGHIPSKYTCEGEDISPPLAWEGVPIGQAVLPDLLVGPPKNILPRRRRPLLHAISGPRPVSDDPQRSSRASRCGRCRTGHAGCG